jgi:hypothetical protein
MKDSSKATRILKYSMQIIRHAAVGAGITDVRYTSCPCMNVRWTREYWQKSLFTIYYLYRILFLLVRDEMT